VLASGSQTPSPRSRLRRLALASLGLTLLLAACGGGDDDDDQAAESPEERPSVESSARGARTGGGAEQLAPGSSWAANVKAEVPEVAIYDSAEATEPSQTLSNPDEYGTPRVFLVDGTEVGGDRVPVFLPLPPSGSTGWVNAADVDLIQNPYRVRVETGAHRLTVTQGEETVVDTTVGVGRDGRETPPGSYYVMNLFQPPNPDGDYGTYFFAISGFPTQEEVLAEFGEDAVIGIHGTNQPDALGTDVSSGCIRMANEVISEIASYLPLGTPVEIVA
jgi:lipoprotein-anchoring transpeptidase ErfK/SrfK